MRTTGLLLLAAIVALLLVLPRLGTQEDDGTSDASYASVPPAATAQSPQDQNPGRSSPGNAQARDEYSCVAMKDQCIDDPLTAATEDEAEWLLRFGYPSHSRLEQLEQMSPSRLQQLSAAGDLPARIVLGKHELRQGNHAEGRAIIADALVNGSTYAAYELARSNNAETPGGTKTDAAAYYRLAYLLGDWKASRELYRTQPGDVLEMSIADERAMELYRNMLQERGQLRLPLRIQPRP